MKKTIASLSLMLALLGFSAIATAKPLVKVDITAEKEITIEKDGKKIVKRIPVSDVVPGDIIIYTLHYENKGSEAASNVILNDPIPAATVYVDGSAFGPGAEITFSIDGGKTYKKPSLLTYTVESNGKKKTLQASPETYTHIRWVIDSIGAGKSGIAGFKARVK